MTGPRVLVVTWPSGGALTPPLGIGRELASRGATVRVLAHASLGERVRAAGCEHVAFPASAEFDPAAGRACEDQLPYLQDIFFGPMLTGPVENALRSPTDVVVVDYLLRTATATALSTGVPVVGLAHMLHSYYAAEVSAGMERLLVTVPREIDEWPDPPNRVVHVGPIAESSSMSGWRSPWPADDRRPLVVVSLGTTYMHQEDQLRRIMTGLGSLDVRVLVLTGSELEPNEIQAPPGVAVAGFVPHAELLPHADLVISHAGMGTVLAALAAGLPSVCMPLGRDQHVNADRAARLGAAVVLPADATPASIRDAAHRALTNPRFRQAAERLSRQVTGSGGAVQAADQVLQVTRARASA